MAAMMCLLVALRLWRPVLILGLAAVAAVVVLWLVDFELETSRGTLSARAVIERQISTIDFLGGGRTAEQVTEGDGGTIYWRTLWWQALLDEQLADEHLILLGRGFGPDLREPVIALASGALNWDQGSEDGRVVRSPHNIAMTILSRTGVLGLLLWLGLLAVGWWRIVRATAAARLAGDRDNEMFGVWLAVSLVVILVTALLGVILESPFGAIPFFFLLGLGVAWANSRLRAPDPHPPG
jgi:O-antigen ligase